MRYKRDWKVRLWGRGVAAAQWRERETLDERLTDRKLEVSKSCWVEAGGGGGGVVGGL